MVTRRFGIKKSISQAFSIPVPIIDATAKASAGRAPARKAEVSICGFSIAGAPAPANEFGRLPTSSGHA